MYKCVLDITVLCVRTDDDDFLVIYLCQRVCSIRRSPKCISIWGVERIEIATMAQKSHRMGDIGCPAALAYIIACQLSK